jgi:hypothetical protein
MDPDDGRLARGCLLACLASLAVWIVLLWLVVGAARRLG